VAPETFFLSPGGALQRVPSPLRGLERRRLYIPTPPLRTFCIGLCSAGVYPPRLPARGTRLRPPARRADFGVASKAPRFPRNRCAPRGRSGGPSCRRGPRPGPRPHSQSAIGSLRYPRVADTRNHDRSRTRRPLGRPGDSVQSQSESYAQSPQTSQIARPFHIPCKCILNVRSWASPSPLGLLGGATGGITTPAWSSPGAFAGFSA